MRTLQKLVTVLAGIIAAASIVTPVHAQDSSAITSRFAEVNGTRLRYLIAGNGDPVLLLHGYAQTSHMWVPLISELAKSHTVIAPDLRGFGDSANRQAVTTKRRWRKTFTLLRRPSDTSASASRGTISA